MKTFADRAIPYYLNLTDPPSLPPGVGVLNPFRQLEVAQICREFYGKFFSDTSPRVYVLGINPGRFGAGVTGISFTTPQNLKRYCGIDNNLPPTPELSSRFIYQIVEAFGGAEAFYGRFFLSSLYPLALVKEGKNYNFYDDKATTATLWPDIVASVQQQLAFGCNRNVAVCLGRKNEAFLHKLNQQHGFFGRIVTLDHPRYILQYRSRDIDSYVDNYVTTLADCVSL
ncbi:uracil-DNA glycosylase family protein [Larkinella insperata]|uniref:Uracil-DNA glycosylase family protein n=1 Tax=Larkinella insperata TaxID=332158 RepID=A0ABW3Q105_9BACT|nr:uracil-DNA glycosylase family protein [Larkinella insperata]